jgi:hypothetical protein
MNIDMLSASGHKIHGPKGVGAMYIRKGVKILSYIHGGAQERRRRAGTHNVPGIVGMGKAVDIAAETMEEKGLQMRDRVISPLFFNPGNGNLDPFYLYMNITTPDTLRKVLANPEKYAPGGPVFAIYSIGLLLRCTYFGMVLNTTGKTKIVLYSAIGTLCLNVIMNIALYQLIGVTGPALATLLASVAMNTFQLLFSSRLIHVKFSRIFPWKNMAVILALNAALGLAFHFIHIRLFPGWFQAIVLAAAWGVVYGLILLKPGKRYWRKLKTV